MAKHYLIFIHGIGQSRKKPQTEREDKDTPKYSYDRLWESIAKESGNITDFKQNFGNIYTNWHIDPLENASNELQKKTFGDLLKSPFNPMRGIREFMTFFLGDVIAYVSEDVNFIRRTVWETIWQQLEFPLKNENATYSIVAHSLGTAIAFDYVFDLFVKDELFVPELDPEKRIEDKKLDDIALSKEEIGLLRSRFRHLFTLGSPIGLFMLRKGSLWIDKTPAFSTLINPVRGTNRRWFNFWDSEDPIAYPLENLFPEKGFLDKDFLDDGDKRNSHLEDIPVETGFLLVNSHTGYWKNQYVARKIAETLVNTQ